MAGKGITVTPELIDYLLEHSLPRTDVHRDLVTRTEEAMGDWSIMQISPEQGPFLTFLARLIGAQEAIEVGTFTGLSALCIAEGLGDGGHLTCFDISDEYVSVGRPFWERAGMADRIDVVIGPAAETLAAFTPPRPVDLAFIDADKPGYATYYELVLERLRPGGLVVFDNALYSGAVLDPSDDENTRAIMSVNDAVAADDRVEAVLLNVGDGLLMARKR
ncbi:O-methyltransferase [Dermatobacter hominis]|uniref:O-methyltransferase n=1 Tax=Dermatobacter hominis TaxID=2884263 RepID=UPI001D0F6813|nr:class I SAM-dependent methyltransferase [Dermatobacter hominis]UDY37775.1 class I SAM-dependent methyltransferase [Dermatobacter hominis]